MPLFYICVNPPTNETRHRVAAARNSMLETYQLMGKSC
uniref:Uncharacterized protein n=1 Tax=Anguilla anguilla TaxID=7936 RepID=A0A0E9U2R2_ANGAN